MKSFEASAGSPTKKYVVMVDLKAALAATGFDGALEVLAVGAVVEGCETGVVDEVVVAGVVVGTRKACGSGVLCAHTVKETTSATDAKTPRMMDKAFMVGHSSNLAAL